MLHITAVFRTYLLYGLFHFCYMFTVIWSEKETYLVSNTNFPSKQIKSPFLTYKSNLLRGQNYALCEIKEAVLDGCHCIERSSVEPICRTLYPYGLAVQVGTDGYRWVQVSSTGLSSMNLSKNTIMSTNSSYYLT